MCVHACMFAQVFVRESAGEVLEDFEEGSKTAEGGATYLNAINAGRDRGG